MPDETKPPVVAAPVVAEPVKPVETKTEPEPVKPYVFDTAKFEAKIAEFNKATDEVAGKPNYNPYMYLTKNGVTEAVRQYKLGNRSKEVFDTVMRVPATIPVIDVNYVAPVPYKAELPKALRPPERK